MWDYVPHGLTFCRWRGGLAGVGSSRLWSQGVERVDPSPRDRQIKHVLKKKIKWNPSDALPVDTWKLLERRITIGRTMLVDKAWSHDRIATLPDQIGRLRRFVEEHHDRGPIEPRSRRDRAAIVTPSGRINLYDLQKGILEERNHDWSTIVTRSRRDRGLIAARSWSNRGFYWG